MVVCCCSVCECFQYKDFTGQLCSGGHEVDAPTARAHYHADQIACQMSTHTDEESIATEAGNAILLATVAGEPSKDLPI